MRVLSAWALLAWGIGAASAQQPVRSYRYDVAVDIDTHGHVARVGLPDDVPASLAGPLREAVARWHFKPPTRHGVAVPARTYARTRVLVVPKAQGTYGLRVDYLSNGPSLTVTKLPQYTSEMIRARMAGTVRMAAVVQSDGTLTDIRVKHVDISENTSRPGRVTKILEEKAREYMQAIRAKPEWIDGSPVATAVEVPVGFSPNASAAGAGAASGSAVGH